MKTPAAETWKGAVLAVVLAVGCSGCATNFPWRKVPLDAASGLYADMTLNYRLDAARLGQPLDVVRIESQRISYDQVASSPLPDESVGTLSITYPHPLGRSGYALARFTLDSAQPTSGESAKGWNPFRKRPAEPKPSTGIATTQPEVHETWELDIPSTEVDQIIKMLTNLGFYQSERPGPARLAVRMSGVEQVKDWDEIPALNLLVQRVRTSGRLVAYARPTPTDGAARSSIASTAAYQDLLVRRGAAGPTPAALASAFAMPAGAAPGFDPAGLPGAVPAPQYPTTPNPAGLAQRPPATGDLR